MTERARGVAPAARLGGPLQRLDQRPEDPGIVLAQAHEASHAGS